MRGGDRRLVRLAALAALAIAGGVTACNAILGVSDLPPATDGGAADGATVDTGHATRSDAHDAGRTLDAARSDATVADAAGDAGPADAAKPPTFAVTPAAVLFGDAGGKAGFVACGANGPTEDVVVTNNGPSSIPFWTSLGLGASSTYTVSPQCTELQQCTVAGNAGTFVLHVTGPSVAADAGRATYDETLTVNPNGLPSATVALETSSYGAVIGFSQSNVDFGPQPANQLDGGYPQSLQLENTGTAPFTGRLSVLPGSGDGGPDAAKRTPEFEVAYVGDAAAGDATLVAVPELSGTGFTVTFDPGGTIADAAASLVLTPAGTTPLCGPLPARVTLEGQGTADPISVTSSLSFDTGPNGNGGAGVSCGTSSAPQNVTITNVSKTTTAKVTGLTLGLGAASPFTVPATTPTIVIPPATAAGPGSATIQVTPSSIPASASPGESFDDVLTVTTDVAGDPPHVVPLKMTAAGVVLTVPATSMEIGTTQQGSTTRLPVYVTNAGNVDVTSAGLTASTNNSTFTWQVGPLPAFNRFPQPFVISFMPITTGKSVGTATLTLGAGVPVCSPPTTDGSAPFHGTLTMSLVGHGAATVYDAVNPPPQLGGPAPFPLTPTCGSVGTLGTSQTHTFQLINRSDPKPVTWAAALSGPGAAQFTLGAESGTVTMAGTPVTLTALGLGSTSGLTAAEVAYGIAVTVTFTLTGSDTEIYTFPILEEPQGVFLSWSPAALAVPVGASEGLSLFNGNAYSATVTLTSDAAGFPLTLFGSSSPRLGQPMTAFVSDRGATGGQSATITASVSASTLACGPIPAPLPVKLASPDGGT